MDTLLHADCEAKVLLPGNERSFGGACRFQWLEILSWFVLKEARQANLHETSLMKVMPRLIAARDAAGKLKNGLQGIHEKLTSRAQVRRATAVGYHVHY